MILWADYTRRQEGTKQRLYPGRRGKCHELKRSIGLETEKHIRCVCLCEIVNQVQILRNFLGGPMFKTLPSNAGDDGSIPDQGTMIQHAVWHGQENKKKEEKGEDIGGTQHLSFIELLICQVNCPSTQGNSAIILRVKRVCFQTFGLSKIIH